MDDSGHTKCLKCLSSSFCPSVFVSNHVLLWSYITSHARLFIYGAGVMKGKIMNHNVGLMSVWCHDEYFHFTSSSKGAISCHSFSSQSFNIYQELINATVSYPLQFASTLMGNESAMAAVDDDQKSIQAISEVFLLLLLHSSGWKSHNGFSFDLSH